MYLKCFVVHVNEAEDERTAVAIQGIVAAPTHHILHGGNIQMRSNFITDPVPHSLRPFLIVFQLILDCSRVRNSRS